jgi:glycosyltransferase involved in cell wall biosynthesis
MRVSIITETYPPEINGVALTVHGFAHGLSARGHAVHIIRPRQHAQVLEPWADTLEVRGFALPRYPGLRFGLPAGGRLRRAWTESRPDVVYIATEGPLGASALEVAHRLRIPACTGFHTRFDEYVAHYGLGFLAPAVRSRLRRFHRRAAATLVPTQELVDELSALSIDNVRLLRRAVDTALFRPTARDPVLRASWGVRENGLAVLYVGRIASEKNLDLAIRAFRTLQIRVPTARYIWIGDGPEREALEAANPDFIFVGTQHDEALARCYASADLFLFPSLTETFGNVTLEAMASGLAVVAYDRGAAREHITDGINGMRVSVGDAAGFITAAFAVASDPLLRDVIRTKARSAVATLSPDTVIVEFETLLANLAAEGRHGHYAIAASA